MSKVRLPELARVDRGRLWLSYQRYAFLLFGVPAVVLAASLVFTPWWLTIIVALAGIWPVLFGFTVFARWPRKLRATRIALARIEAGTFTQASIKAHCGDPCFRVVANEVLSRAATPRSERRRIIQLYAEQLRNEASMFVLIDHVRGTTITFGGEQRRRT